MWNELSIDKAIKVTLVIPTFNRYNYLYRLLLFYQKYQFPFKILILDSSSDENKNENLKKLFDHPSIEYKKYPTDKIPLQKIANGISMVETPYSFLCADDDFVMPYAVNECVEYLEQNSDYVMAHGNYISFMELDKKQANGLPEIFWTPLYYKKMPVLDESAQNRLHHHMDKYGSPTFYAVHRSSVLKLAFQDAQHYSDDWGIQELLPSAISIVYGKMAILPFFYCARSDSGQSGGGASGQRKDWYTDEKVKRAALCVAKHLSQQDQLDSEQANMIAEKAIRAFTDDSISSDQKINYSQIRRNIRMSLKKIGLEKIAICIKRLLFGEIMNKEVQSFKNKYEEQFIDANHISAKDFSCFRDVLKHSVKTNN